VEGTVRDLAIDSVRSRAAGVDGKNLAREYLQSRILGALQESGAFTAWAFMGGTALRFLYRIPRFSEDLDFSLERADFAPDFGRVVASVLRAMEREGYDVRGRVNDSAIVLKAEVGFRGLLAEMGLSAHSDETLWVKIELDGRPPAGAGMAVTLVNRFGPLRLNHHDLPSLFAGKVAAVLGREYTKGRDLYDLVWYLSNATVSEPNPVLLRGALAQVAPEFVPAVEKDWRSTVRERLGDVDWADARRDVEPFLEQQRDLALIDPEVVFAALAGSC
jgi:predicted nucleotidyltransferase component of viral defense system